MPLDLRYLFAAGAPAGPLFGQYRLLVIEVPEVAGRNHAERADKLRIETVWSITAGGSLVRCHRIIHDPGRYILAVEEHSPHPGKMVEPHVVDSHSIGRGTQRPRELDLDTVR